MRDAKKKWKKAALSVPLSLFVFFVTKKIYSPMILAGISEDLAKTQRIPVKKYHFLYLLCIALTVALGVRIVGGADDRGPGGHPVLRRKKYSHESGSVFLQRIFLWQPVVYSGHSCIPVHQSSDRAIDRDCEYFFLFDLPTF